MRHTQFGRLAVVGATASLIVLARGAAQEETWASPGQTAPATRRPTGPIPATHTVQNGDTLWDLSGRYYGNPWDWPRLWSFNPDITNPHWIYPASTVRLTDGTSAPQPAAATPGVHVVRRAPMGDGEVYLREVGFLDTEALEQSGEIVGSRIDHMLLAPPDPIYIHFDRAPDSPTGEFTIYREYDASERNAGESGTLVRILGTVRIDSYDSERRLAQATLTEALEPIERGQRVAAVPRRFDTVPPVVADAERETSIVATLTPQQLLGDQQVVFIPLGERDGVRVGHRFYVVREADGWTPDLPVPALQMGQDQATPTAPEEWPEEVIAEGRVVSLRPHSAALMLTRAIVDARVGDRVESRRGY